MFIMFVFEVVMLFFILFKCSGDVDNFSKVMNCFQCEDFIFCVYVDFESEEIIIFGMGEFYFEVYVECFKCEYKCECVIGQFCVVYCEIIFCCVDFDFFLKC